MIWEGMVTMFKKFKQDYFVMTQKSWNTVGGALRVIKHRNLRICFWGRIAASDSILACIGKLFCRYYESKFGLEISFKKIEGGLLLLHPYNITVNSKAILGHNVTLFKGCTIGSIRSGKREGVPIIGDRVTLCVNATVVGNVKIGNDVLIAANAMVDFNVPDNSVVIGNPGQIRYKENASKDYLTGL